MIKKMRRFGCAKRKPMGLIFIAGLVVGMLGLSGCGTTGVLTASSSAVMPESGKPVESYSQHHPGMVLYSDEMLALLAEREGQGEAGITDWVSRRNDYSLGLGSVVWDPYAYSEVVVTQDDYLYDSNGRPHSSSWRRVRTIRSGRQR